MFILIQGEHGNRNGDTMLLDSVTGHQRTFQILTAFLASSDGVVEMPGAGPCHLWPDSPTLNVFRMVKTEGLLRTEELPGGVLQVSGRPDLLARYVNEFLFGADQDGDHRHPETALAAAKGVDPTSDSIIIQVENDLDGGRG